jgi:hypothetical protein
MISPHNVIYDVLKRSVRYRPDVVVSVPLPPIQLWNTLFSPEYSYYNGWGITAAKDSACDLFFIFGVGPSTRSAGAL